MQLYSWQSVTIFFFNVQNVKNICSTMVSNICINTFCSLWNYHHIKQTIKRIATIIWTVIFYWIICRRNLYYIYVRKIHIVRFTFYSKPTPWLKRAVRRSIEKRGFKVLSLIKIETLHKHSVTFWRKL